MRIAIVNDISLAVEALRRTLKQAPQHEIAWVAYNGLEAVNKCVHDRPDLILMDLFMPEMDGVEATKRIMQQSPCAILVVTADVQHSSAKVFEAMGYGALDAVNTPTFGKEDSHLLLSKIHTIGKLIGKTKFVPIQSRVPLIVIGASTGGPKAIVTILSQLPPDFGSAIVIVQHVDVQFAAGMIDWLNQQTALEVRKAKVGDRPTKGIVLFASTNDHLCLQPNGTLTYTPHPISYPYRPSVDVFFKSVAQYWTDRGTAVLLTGMGRDGAEGLKALRQQGWYTIAQNEPSCVVYGMPKAAIDLGAAVDVLSPDAIASVLLHRSHH
ncbi:chemotaxis response regulator protein-glutamate methylesterase [Leptolyngbya sp. NIES-2104]|uniref:chemotaxis response regulator protein-glutamate methylesterase n=1 Tax=Leptolyngbya sp. NIES-2104 TaxID=1552121 RepID=UPI0006EC747D|nr:chemotaxis response regulator protein-glutamate methylesterase [Leptolyngbya sp. NIES-2104]GAP99256.1 chemotaxis response regulator protein-glutamate methylesterase CheB [Leptolyngbya sp. NIES-2104]